MKMKMIALTLSLLLVFAYLTGCSGMDGQSALLGALAQSDGSTSGGDVLGTGAQGVEAALAANLTASDTDAGWDDSATVITLSGSSALATGEGASVSGSTVTITNAGTYVISGTLADGQIVIAAKNTDKVHLILNGADITNQTGAPVYASQCDKLIVTLADGTENRLSDGGASFQYADTANEEPNAALFCKDDLAINGQGSLQVNAGFHNGIGTKDDLVIISGNIAVNAANHGLRGNDSVTIVDGSLNITAGGDGIQTHNTEDLALGWVLIQGGALHIVSIHDGIQADTALVITNGDISVAAGGTAVTDASSDSFKGIKSGGTVLISGGSLDITSADDGIHAGSNIIIEGGAFTISTGDDGIHADGDITVSGGDIKISESYEGIEAANIYITGGTMDIISSDDAVNAAGGADQSGFGGRFGGGGFGAADAYSIQISGGSITFQAGGDGLDSNGTIHISGGSLVALIHSTPDNQAIDADGSITVTGGTIVYGGTGTGTPGPNSTQSYVFVSSGIAAGQELTVKKDGQTLMTFVSPVDCQYLAFSSSDIIGGESYDIYSGSSLVTTAAAGEGSAGMQGGGWPGGNGRPGTGDMPQGGMPGSMPDGGEMPGGIPGGEGGRGGPGGRGK